VQDNRSNFDGIAEIWVRDILGAKASSNRWLSEESDPDEEEFMDRKRCELLYTHEYNVMA